MNTFHRGGTYPLALLILVAVGLLGSRVLAQAPVQLYTSGWSNWTTIESAQWSGSTSGDVEAADDFTLTGTISKVVMGGNTCFACLPPNVQGAWVRFYANQGGMPGALESEEFLPAGSASLVFNSVLPAGIEAILATPFVATGTHWVSMQLVTIEASSWQIWVAANNAPVGSALRSRNRATGTPWAFVPQIIGGTVNADLSFELWGGTGTPPPPGTDPCGTWRVLNTPWPTGASTTVLTGLSVAAANDVWAVGRSTPAATSGGTTAPFATRWNGSSWNTVTVPPVGIPGFWSDFRCIARDPNGTLFFGGQQTYQQSGGWTGGQLLLMQYQAGQWTTLTAPQTTNWGTSGGVTGAWVQDIEAVGPDTVWMSGNWFGGTSGTQRVGLLMRWDGSNFTSFATPYVAVTSNGQVTEDISAVDQNDIWVIGGTSTGNMSTPSFIWHWNGSQWSHRPGPTPGDRHRLTSVAAVSANDVWVSGYYQIGASGPLTPFFLHWNGSQWSVLPSPNFVTRLKAFNASDIYGVGATILRFNGTTWVEVDTLAAVSGPSLWAIDGLSPCEPWVTGRQIIGGDVVPMNARVESYRYWDSNLRPPCSVGAFVSSISLLSPPELGTTLGVAMDASGIPFLSGGSAFWFVSLAPYGTGNCGLPLSLGVPARATELLIDPSPNALIATFGPLPWLGPGQPAILTVPLPSIPGWAGSQLYTQGAFVNLTGTAITLTTALDLRLGF